VFEFVFSVRVVDGMAWQWDRAIRLGLAIGASFLLYIFSSLRSFFLLACELAFSNWRIWDGMGWDNAVR
jgi:hypothetical protein